MNETALTRRRARALIIATGLIFAAMAVGACATAGPATVDPMADVTLPGLPSWTNKYESLDEGDGRFFALTKLMAAHDLTRLGAIEVQNHYRDLSRAEAPGGPAAWYREAVRRAKAGVFESGVDADALAAAPFIVVFDLDDTLYDQYLHADGKPCADVYAGAKKRAITLAPGWAESFAAIRALGGTIVLYSANRDEPTRANLVAWEWKGLPLLGHPEIGGVLTNSYLILQGKLEDISESKRGAPVAQPSKDLRILDPSMSRVIIVDDNPSRLFQPRNVRLIHKFDGDLHCARRDDPETRVPFDATLAAVTREIEETVTAAAERGISFVDAYLPYTQIGQTLLDTLMSQPGWTRTQAIAWIRDHPDAIHKRF